MKKAASGDTVQIYFTGTTDDGFSFSGNGSEEEGFEVTLGIGQLLPAFESQIIGMAPGETKKFSVNKKEGIPRQQELIFEVEREILPEDQEFAVDDDLVLSMPNGERLEVIITALSDEKVTLDANLPIAGKDLSVEIKLLSIEDEEE